MSHFLSRCRLVRVGLYVGSPKRCAVLDFTIGKDVTNYVLAVSFDATGMPCQVDMES